jgi:peptidoglycan/LPS O-acetylase OafA/YrhL
MNSDVRREIRSHTALRGIAALLVVLYHYPSFLASNIHPDQFSGFLRLGYLWVDVFFVLSGFILAYVYRVDRTDAKWRESISSFAAARFSRIYPLHLLATIAVLLFFIADSSISYFTSRDFCCVLDGHFRTVESFVGNVFLVHAWGFWDQPTWNIPSWSISAEMFCYIALAISFLLPPRFRTQAFLLAATMALVYYAAIMIDARTVDEKFQESIFRAFAGFATGLAMYRVRSFTRRIHDLAMAILQGAILALLA